MGYIRRRNELPHEIDMAAEPLEYETKWEFILFLRKNGCRKIN
ncbi:hypothetical protein SAMN05421807_12316 [Virgibacillus chiguensis]|uniref:Uncharacterized protein n=1 Tax=Virgibacillus chiguensis TaxID=411959 RepID=A0A1M5X9Q5_9BACI|nr:hypothetical protein SAMN05421807_12316 [Virgibacillus chiguensis]